VIQTADVRRLTLLTSWVIECVLTAQQTSCVREPHQGASYFKEIKVTQQIIMFPRAYPLQNARRTAFRTWVQEHSRYRTSQLRPRHIRRFRPELTGRFGIQGLLTASTYEMCLVQGIGPKKAAQLKAPLNWAAAR